MNDWNAIEEFVRQEFAGRSEIQIRDLIAESMLFLQVNELGGGQLARGSKLYLHLIRYFNREISSGSTKHQVSINTSSGDLERNKSDENRSQIIRSMRDDPGGAAVQSSLYRRNVAKEEAADALDHFREKIETLRTTLPVMAFEALERTLEGMTTRHRTLGLDPIGDLVFYKRARIRIRWPIPDDNGDDRS